MKKNALKNILSLLIIIVSVFAFASMFMSALTNGEETYKGVDLAFGKELNEYTVFGQTTKITIKSSIYVIVGYLLPLLATLISVFLLFIKSKAGNVILSILIFAVFLVSFVLLLNIGIYSSYDLTITGVINNVTTFDFSSYTFTKEGIKCLLALVLGASFSFSNVCISLIK